MAKQLNWSCVNGGNGANCIRVWYRYVISPNSKNRSNVTDYYCFALSHIIICMHDYVYWIIQW